jgi:hypothetical protein
MLHMFGVGKEARTDERIVQMLDSTFSMTTVMICDDLIILWLMRAISLWILENGTCPITYE